MPSAKPKDHPTPLLGHLAGEGWFAAMGEVAATKSLAWLSADPQLRAAILAHLGALAGTDLTHVDRFVPEPIDVRGSRPDLELLDGAGHTVAIVEAKFAARLGAEQIHEYLQILERRSGPHPGTLFVLVPARRTAEARRVIDRVMDNRLVRASHAVITWDEWLQVWADAAEGVSDPSIAQDVRQLRAMCETLGGLVIPPLGDAVTGHGWRERREDLVTLVSAVTTQLLGSTRPSELPLQGDLVSKPWTYRYLPPISPDTWVQVGAWARFADEGLTPFWLMIHRDDKGTGGFQNALDRLLASPAGAAVRRDDGHAWTPLVISPDAAGPEVVTDLARQVNVVLTLLKTDEAVHVE